MIENLLSLLESSGFVCSKVTKNRLLIKTNEPRNSVMSDLLNRLKGSKKILDKKYSSVGHIEYEGITIVVKPMGGSIRSILPANSLKPQNLNMPERMGYSEYIKKLKEGLDKNSAALGETGIYCTLLVQNILGEISDKELSNYFIENKAKIDEGQINKDFGETIGPMGCKELKLFNKIHQITDQSRIYFPTRPNEPLMDYSIDDYVISAKSGATTNTVKPADLVKLLANDKTWSKSFQYKIFETIISETALKGSIKIVELLSRNGFKEYSGLDLKSFDKISKANDHIDILSNKDFLKNNAMPQLQTKIKTGKPITLNELMYNCDKIVEKVTKSSPKCDFTQIFKDSIDNKVYYVKFEIDYKGLPNFELITANDIVNSRPYLRSKSGFTRAKDKLGIQL